MTENTNRSAHISLMILFLLSGFLLSCMGKAKDGAPSGRILYTKILSEFNQGIYLMNAEGNDIERLTPVEIISPPIISPVLSPNNEYIAFGCDSQEMASNICIIEREGLWPQPLAPYQSYKLPHSVFRQGKSSCADSPIDSITWSPDGNQLVLTCSLPQSEGKQICIVDWEGEGNCWPLTSIKPQNEQKGQVYVAWSPIEDILAISLQSEIYLTDIAGKNSVFLVEGEKPTWSPDGQRLLFFQDGPQLSVIHPDGSDLECLYHSPEMSSIEDIDRTPILINNSVATWSPDGNFVAFTASLGGWNEGSDAIYVLNLEKRRVNRITPFDDGRFTGLDWSQ